MAGIFTFADANKGEQLDMTIDNNDIATYDHLGETDLDKFFSRPRLIRNFTWTSGWTYQTFFPWKDYFDNTIIKNKISNYAYLRCNLHVKFVINATPYYFGAMQAAYLPMNLDLSAQNYAQPDVDSVIAKYVQSVLPSVLILPHKNQGGELVLPFVYDRNFLPLNEADNLQFFGSIFLEELATLADLQGGTPACLVQVYAWATDVILTGATQLAVLQTDEYSTRPVSKTATAIANIASTLTQVPYIGPFATATSIGAKAISAIATMFGYTNVPSLEPAHALRPTALGDFASSSIGSSIEKLALDPKNEITIDPRPLGVDEDHMAIKSIVTRKALINRVTWSPSSANGTVVFSSRVTPQQRQLSNGQLYLPPVSHIAPLFGQWRGDIIYTFRCINTVFHRGRLRIAWDPRTSPDTSNDGTLNSYSYLWDLTKEDEVEFRVPYQAATAFLKCSGVITTDNQGTTSQSATQTSNGVVSVIIETPITPVAPAPGVYILVYMRAAEDFIFSNPVNVLNEDNLSLKVSIFKPQSGFSEESAITQWSIDSRNENPNLFKVHMGERVESIRPLLLRTNLHATVPCPTTSTTTDLLFKYTIPRQPRFFGYDPVGMDGARNQAGTANANFNWVQQTPYTWLAPAFIYERGAHIWRTTAHKSQGEISATRTFISSDPTVPTFPLGNGLNIGVSVTTYDGNSRNAVVSNYGTKAKGSGTSVNMGSVNSSVQVAAPIFSEYRAISTFPHNVCNPPCCLYDGIGVQVMNFNAYAFNSAKGRDYLTFQSIVPRENTAVQGVYNLYHAAGVDLSFTFYRGCPRLFVYTDIPEPAA